MDEREKFMVNKKSFSVDVLPEFSPAFESSKSVSGIRLILNLVRNGRSHFFLRKPGN